MYWHSPQSTHLRKGLPCTPLVTHSIRVGRVAAALVGTTMVLAAAAASEHAAMAGGDRSPTLVGRAVLPVETYAPGPPSGTLLPAGVVNGISFPLPSQPVEGFSAIVDGRHRGEYLAMTDNGFGGKATSKDFLIRAYYIEPDFKTAAGGDGSVDVGLDDYIQFSDPNHLIGFTIVNESTTERALTGGDIDPESLQRGGSGICGSATSSGHGSCTSTPRAVSSIRRSRRPVA